MTDQEIRRLAASPTTESPLSGVTVKDGLLLRHGVVIDLPEADILAAKCGLLCAERLVRILESKPVIEGIKLIKHNMGGVNRADDPSYPFRLDAIFRVPGFMEVAASFIYGREEIVVRGMTAEKLEEFIAANGLRTHPRLTKLDITQPEAPLASVISSAANRSEPPTTHY